MENSIFVIEAKDMEDISGGKDFETTNWTFHTLSEAKTQALELIDDGNFIETRVREYKPDKNDKGILFKCKYELSKDNNQQDINPNGGALSNEKYQIGESELTTPSSADIKFALSKDSEVLK